MSDTDRQPSLTPTVPMNGEKKQQATETLKTSFIDLKKEEGTTFSFQILRQEVKTKRKEFYKFEKLR